MEIGGNASSIDRTNGDSSTNIAGFADHLLTTNDIAVIRERFHGWEEASATTLAAVFGVSVQRITAIVHSNRPDGMAYRSSGKPL